MGDLHLGVAKLVERDLLALLLALEVPFSETAEVGDALR
jgi:hypothetical protein